MDIATLGALGEFIGGLAVVVSLVAVGSWRRRCAPRERPALRPCDAPPPPCAEELSDGGRHTPRLAG